LWFLLFIWITFWYRIRVHSWHRVFVYFLTLRLLFLLESVISFPKTHQNTQPLDMFWLKWVCLWFIFYVIGFTWGPWFIMESKLGRLQRCNEIERLNWRWFYFFGGSFVLKQDWLGIAFERHTYWCWVSWSFEKV
jgi:hypothetical protein